MTLRWWMPPLLAIQFMTRIPVPGLSRLHSEDVAAGMIGSVGWYPLAGGLVGMISAAVLVLAEGLWARSVAVVIMLIVEARAHQVVAVVAELDRLHVASMPVP